MKKSSSNQSFSNSQINQNNSTSLTQAFLDINLKPLKTSSSNQIVVIQNRDALKIHPKFDDPILEKYEEHTGFKAQNFLQLIRFELMFNKFSTLKNTVFKNLVNTYPEMLNFLNDGVKQVLQKFPKDVSCYNFVELKTDDFDPPQFRCFISELDDEAMYKICQKSRNAAGYGEYKLTYAQQQVIETSVLYFNLSVSLDFIS